MGSFHKIVTFHGSKLLAELATGHIGNGPEGAAGTVPVIGYRPSERARVLYLAAHLPDGIVPALRPMEPVGNVVPAALSRTADNGAFGIYSAWSGLFLVAAPPATPADTAHAILATVVPQEWEMFSLQDAADSEVPESLRAAMALLDQVSAPEPSAISVLALIESAPPAEAARDVLNAAGLMLSKMQLSRLAAVLPQRTDIIAKLEEIYPYDLAAQHALRRTSDWLVARGKAPRPEGSGGASARNGNGRFRWLGAFGSARTEVPRPTSSALDLADSHIARVGPELDRLDTVGLAGTFVSLPHACNIVMRRRAAPRRRSCVLATAKNEGLYLIEWIAHHKALRFDHCFIYSNDNSDGSDQLLRCLADAGEITWVQNSVSPGTRPQWKAYNHALQMLPQILDYEWTLVIDLDEYFTLNHAFFLNVDDYLDWCERSSVDAIALNWVIIGPNGETHWRDLPLRQRFPMGSRASVAAKAGSLFIKSMFRTRMFPVSMPHHPTPFREEGFVFRSASMRNFDWDRSKGPGESISTDVTTAWISHYFYKSNEEFLLKFYRARGDDKFGSGAEFPALSAEFVSSFVKASGSFGAIAEPHPMDDIVQANVQRLIALPGIAAADAAIKRFYAEFLGSLPLRALSCRGIVEAGEEGEALLRPLLIAEKTRDNRIP